MSKSIHKTYAKDIRGLTNREIDEQAKDPNSDLAELGRKSAIKKNVKKERKNIKAEKNIEILINKKPNG
jgi:hypothetical protein